MSKELNLGGVGMTSQRTRSRLVQRLRERGITDERVLEVINATPRHAFIDEALAHRAYEDTALPIGFSQTISQPYIVARMTEILLAGPRVSRVLEIGTGSGYQAAILAQLVDRVYSVERIKGLLDRANKKFRLLGLRNITTRYDDGGIGWEVNSPFDGIIVTASPRHLPEELLEQLADPGRLIAPVGQGEGQQLIVMDKVDGELTTEVLEAVNFVPMLGGKS